MKKQGLCPFCGSENIEYGNIDLRDDFLDYPCKCNNCNKEFIEGYHLEFDGMFDMSGVEIK